METKKITLPEGWEVDKVENGEIYLKETAKRLPNTWEEYEAMCDKGKDVIVYKSKSNKYIDAFAALHKLIQLRDVYRQGWLPNKQKSMKHCIGYNVVDDEIVSSFSAKLNAALCFQSAEIRDKFLENFKDLIEEAKELI